MTHSDTSDSTSLRQLEFLVLLQWFQLSSERENSTGEVLVENMAMCGLLVEKRLVQEKRPCDAFVSEDLSRRFSKAQIFYISRVDGMPDPFLISIQRFVRC